MYTQNEDPKRLVTITGILIAAIIFAIPTAAGTNVSVVVPGYEPVEGETFPVTIKIDGVVNLDSGQFDIYFNSKVVNVADAGDSVGCGRIDGIDIPISNWQILTYVSWIEDKKIRVLFDIPDKFEGVSGSGNLATIFFEVTGKNGDHSVLNFDDDGKPLLVAFNADPINATWTDGNVTIGTSEPDSPPNSTATPTPTSTTKQSYDVSVYVINRDDDKLDVHLLIDGKDLQNQKINSHEISDKYKEPRTKDYELEEGVHTFTIWWYDKGTDKVYIKTEKHLITDVTTIKLLTDEHTKDEDEISAQVYVKNLDDDDQTVYLYIDGNYKKYLSIASNSTGYYDKYEFEEDEDTLHSFKIIWRDPGTDEEYEKITRSHITGKEAVTLYVDKHTKEDMILLPDETPTPVSTRSTSTATTSQSASDSQPSPGKTPSSTTFHTDPTLSENSAENNGLGQGTTWYTLIGLLAVVFALLQIRRS